MFGKMTKSVILEIIEHILVKGLQKQQYCQIQFIIIGMSKSMLKTKTSLWSKHCLMLSLVTKELF